MYALVFASLLVVSWSLILPHEKSDRFERDLFRSWSIRHKKSYTLEEGAQRFQNFRATLKRISESRVGGAVFGLNKFSDLTPEEFKSKYLMKDFEPTPETSRTYIESAQGVAVDSFDWRTRNVVSKVKNQEQCGSCWAFSVTENIESVWMIAHKIKNTSMPALSPQQIVDCDGNDGGCDGGDTPTAYEYVKKAGGLETEKEYPYRAKDESCRFNKDKAVAHISGWKYATSKKDEKTMLTNLVAYSPLSICLDAENWQDYTGGVMSAHQCARHVTLDHCVQVVGFNIKDTKPYWIVRNSWGEDWGEDGYIRLEYGQNTCGLTDEVTTAIA